MNHVAFTEVQLPLFGFHDDSDIAVMLPVQEAVPLSASPGQEVKDDEAERKLDRYIDQGFSPQEAEMMVYGTPLAPKSFGDASVVAAITPHVQQQTQSRSLSRGTDRSGRRFSPKELRAQETLPYDVNER